MAIVVVAVVSTSLLASAFVFHIFGPGTCGSASTNVPSSVHFTVVITETGYNGSKYHSLPWPRMNVTLRQGVTIHVWNNDTTQSHGFAVTHYFDQSVYLRPSDSNDVVFQACELGSFQVYDPTYASNSAFLSAVLNVEP